MGRCRTPSWRGGVRDDGRPHGFDVVTAIVGDDPDSDLYAESSDADTVIGYITARV
jgi:hypothetical protein